MKIDMLEQVALTLENNVIIKAVLGVVVGVFAYFLDITLLPAFIALFILSIMDLFAAYLARGEHPTDPFSTPIRKTTHKIAGYFVSISSVYILAKFLTDDVGLDITILDNMLIGFFIIHEVVSIIENLNKAGIPIPLPFIDKLQKVKDLLGNTAATVTVKSNEVKTTTTETKIDIK